MKKIIGDFSTNIILEDNEPVQICKLGKGSETCGFLVCGSDGFECWKMNYPANTALHNKIDKGEMVAKGLGGWDGCPWKEHVH